MANSKTPKIRFKGFTDDWEQRKLSEVATMHARIGWQNLRKSEFLDSGDYYLITGTDFVDGEVDLANCHYVTKERYEQDPNIQLQNNDVLVTKDGTLGKVAFVKDLTKPATLNSGVFVVRSLSANLKNRFIFHYLKSSFLMNFARGKLTKGTIKHLNQSVITQLPIPIPPLPVQKEIVRILDKFTELIALLTEELKLRKKQYEYYRDKLLTFENVPMVKLGEILKICNGKDWKKFNVGNIPVYGSGGIMTYIDTAIYDKPSVLIPRKGSVDKLYYVDIPFWTVDTIFYTKIDTELANPKFVYFSLKKEHLENLNQAGGVPSLTKSVLDEVKISLPPLEEQERIVNILDKFDKLCNDLCEGIPAEIAARKKQYEYYRDLLLTFEEATK